MKHRPVDQPGQCAHRVNRHRADMRQAVGVRAQDRPVERRIGGELGKPLLLTWPARQMGNIKGLRRVANARPSPARQQPGRDQRPRRRAVARIKTRHHKGKRIATRCRCWRRCAIVHINRAATIQKSPRRPRACHACADNGDALRRHRRRCTVCRQPRLKPFLLASMPCHLRNIEAKLAQRAPHMSGHRICRRPRAGSAHARDMR